jgi:HK97 family phage major capsid protein
MGREKVMELKDLQTQLQTTFEELKQMGQRQEQEIKTFGAATQETKDSITKINASFDEIKGRIDAMETKMNRTGFNGQGGGVDPEIQKKNVAFFKFMREGLAGISREEKALVQDSTGEIIVPEELDSEIYRGLQKLTVMRSLVSARPISTNRQRRRSMNEVTVGWGKLETSATKTLADFESTLTPAFEEYIYVEDLLGLTKIGEDELEDSDINLQAYLADSFTQAAAAAEDLAFLKGTGHANEQPEGILNGTDVTRFNTGAAGTFTADDLIKLPYEVPAQYEKGGQYLVNRKIELAMRLFKDSNGHHLWQPSIQAGTPNVFNGYSVYKHEDMDNTVATGKEIAVFGDFKAAYRVLDRKGGSITRINELYIEDGLIGFKYKRRVGGGLVRPNALRVLKVQ